MKRTVILGLLSIALFNDLNCQDLTIDETLKYLSELCSSENAIFLNSPGEYIFTRDEERITLKITGFFPQYNKNCTSITTFDIRRIKEIDYDKGIACSEYMQVCTVDLIMNDNSVKT